MAYVVLALSMGCSESRVASESHSLSSAQANLLSSFQNDALDSHAWFETQKLTLEGTGLFDPLGERVSLFGNSALVSRGCCRVLALTFSGVRWEVEQELLIEEEPGAETKLSLALSADTALVGVPYSEQTPNGQVYVFSRIRTAWTRETRLLPGGEAMYSGFGTAVAIDGDRAVVGAPREQAAYVFARTGDWTLQKRLVPNNPSTPFEGFGSSVAISGNTVVVGMPADGRYGPASWRGAAHVYEALNGLSGIWAEQSFVRPGMNSADWFGAAVGLDGDDVFVGSSRHRSAVFAFEKAGTFQELTSESDFEGADGFGASLSFSEGRLVVGAPNFQVGPRFFVGAAYVYEKVDPFWTRRQEIFAKDASANALFGGAVAVSGEWMIIGSPGILSDDLAGAVYFQKLLGASGSGCHTNTICGLGHCISGICCENACDGPCEECSTGACLPLAAGSPGEPECAPYLCDGAHRTCPDRCLTSDDCAGSDSFCRDDQCILKAELGEACSGPDQCSSGHCLGRRCSGTLPEGAPCETGLDCRRGHCVDGVCCNDPCRGQCEVCNDVGHEGRCTPVTGPPRGDRDPCTGAGSVCEGSCDGEVPDSCAYPTNQNLCGSRCEENHEMVSTCNGQGACVDGEPRPCAKFVCDEQAIGCRPSCESDRDCAEGLSCWANGDCAPSPRCTADGSLSETAPNGDSYSCRPYLCGTDGNCRTSCASSQDCAPSTACDTHRHCVPLPAEERSGCGCRVGKRQGRTAWSLALLGAALAWRRRRAWSAGRTS